MTPGIVVHGGAGNVEPERHDRLRAAVRAAAAAGHAILDAGGAALDAVVAAVRVLEDDPELNAGRGSVLTRDGTVETDACVMDGATRRAGAVAAVPDLGDAVALARAVLDDGEHVLLAGPAAWRFATERGFRPSPPGSLVTERSRARLASFLADRADAHAPAEGGTVGAVARDAAGRFAAATSTGGTNGKRSGRVGDTPLVGAGTWADARCAVSATGHGEAIIRVALAHRIALTSLDLDAADLDVAPDVAAGAATAAIAATARPAIRARVIAALRELASVTGRDAGVIALDATGWAGIQLSRTMPIAWIAGSDRGDSLGEHLPAAR